MAIKRNALWIIYALFVAGAMLLHEGEPLFISHSEYPAGKLLAWALLLAFLAYSIHCGIKENFFTALKKLWPMYWARQIGLDLYLGLVITLSLMYFNEGSLLVILLWLPFILMYANLATLLYIAMNYDALIANFM